MQTSLFGSTLPTPLPAVPNCHRLCTASSALNFITQTFRSCHHRQPSQAITSAVTSVSNFFSGVFKAN
jgi:hypothetical protein